MSKYRVYELAKDYNTTSKVIIDILARNNIVAKNHMSSVEDNAKAVIERTFARKTGPEMPEPQGQPKPPKEDRNANLRPAQSPASMPAVAPKPAADDRRGIQPQRPQPTAPVQNRQPYPAGQRPAGQAGQARPNPGNSGRYGANAQTGQRPAPQSHNTAQAGQRPPQQGYHQQGGQRPPYSSAPGQQRPPQRPNNMPNMPAGQRPAAPGQGGHHTAGGAPQGQPHQQQRFSQTGGTGSRNIGDRQGPNAPQQQRPNQPGRNDQFRSKNQHTGQGQQQPYSKQQQQQGTNRKGPANTRQRSPQRNSNQRPPMNAQAQVRQEPAKPKVVKLDGPATVKELSSKFGREVSEIIKKLMVLGVMAGINQEVDIETASILGSEFGITVEELPPAEDPTEIPEIEDSPESLLPRPPVVTIMGHVDHGKTSLLDAIRQTNVTAQEAGGITQHIGAYQVNYQGKKVVFLDTPGHEAFTAMRARGAQVTDVAILVVAADDGVMPQTIEAINHAKAAKVPIIVAVNKIDRPEANPDRVTQQLTEHGLVPEQWGGDTIVVPVSAHTKAGISELLEMILLVSEVQDLKANPNRLAYGTIIEAQLDKGRGPVASVLVQKGTLHIGDTIIAGTAFGKVRAMVNERGEKLKKAPPSTPVEVLGLSDVPQAGDILVAVDESTARAVAEKRFAKKRTDEMNQVQKVSLDDLFSQIQEGKLKDLNIVIKADVQGSIEALRQAFAGLQNKEVRVSIVHAGVGAINESDVMLASAANALIIGFNVRPDANSRKAAEAEKIDIRTYRIIYDVINDVEAAMTGMLAPEYKEAVQGRIEVRKVFSVPKAVVAGSYVLEGKVTNHSQIRIIRNGIVIHEGKVESLRRFKDEVKEATAGYECGISIEKFRDIKEGDILEAFTMELVKPGS
ncbi:translation initiation factor IF-2 [Acetonema longum]|nr:translation initiation factor IF-2 [Acetonema longum]